MATNSDTSLFVYKDGNDIAYLLLYINDIVLTASSSTLLQRITSHLSGTFDMKDLRPLHYFLGIHVNRSASGFFLHQAKYTEDVLHRADMLNYKLSPIPVDTSPKSSATTGKQAHDASFYRSIISALHYLTLTRPDFAYVVHQVCLHMHASCDSHWALVKRMLRYIRGTTSHGVHVLGSADIQIRAYSDADWVGPGYEALYIRLLSLHRRLARGLVIQATDVCFVLQCGGEISHRCKCHRRMLLASTTAARATHRCQQGQRHVL
jgi:hypothetical protein